MKIIDCFTFYNERDLLLYRLSILDEVVDYFILVESTLTHKGLPKELHYEKLKNEPEFKRFNHKVIHIVDDELIPNAKVDLSLYQADDVWKNENHQRNSIDKGLKQLNLQDEDLLIIGDADEIPDPRLLSQIKSQNLYIGAAQLLMTMYYYNLCNVMDAPWTLAKIVNYDYYVNNLNRTPQKCRVTTLNHNHLSCGWHLSYFNTPENISNKIQNFAHQEYNTPEYNNIEHIKNCIENNTDIYKRNNNKKYVPIHENQNLPILHDIFLSKYISHKLE